MLTVAYIAKAASPEQAAWRQRIARNQRPLITVFLDWVAGLRAQVSEAALATAIVTRATAAFDHVLQAVAFEPAPVLRDSGLAEAEREFRQVIHGVDARLRLSLEMRDPNFQHAVDEQAARLVREVSDETRRAIGNVIGRAYRDGLHPYRAASEIRQLVGLTSRQAQAVYTYARTLEKQGVKPEVAAARAHRYADRMLTRRAKTIGRTETARAMVAAKQASWQQAAARGLFDPAQAVMVWSSVQTDPAEICATLDGQERPLGQSFDGLLPPVHPCCRCDLRLEIRREQRPMLSLVR